MANRVMNNGPAPRDNVPPPPCSPPPDEPGSPHGNGNGPLRRTIKIINPLGLHWRIAERFSRTAKTFVCAVRVWHGESRADGKSPTDLILLVALPGTELVLEVDGDDAATALEPLTSILASSSGEDYAI